MPIIMKSKIELAKFTSNYLNTSKQKKGREVCTLPTLKECCNKKINWFNIQQYVEQKSKKSQKMRFRIRIRNKKIGTKYICAIVL
jgi:hypothetical protein